TALLEDISPSGACLQLEVAVPVGAELLWECPNHRFAGRVRYCNYRDIGYFAGVQFEAGSGWSSDAYQPQHLLDLKRLVC
ncbi:MAG TPA: PilZ domain-containing protein, partial [Bryobacteraceae bacterium]|nr:PilZ domain-containing protein [Bryobacteraceae bacterium]